MEGVASNAEVQSLHAQRPPHDPGVPRNQGEPAPDTSNLSKRLGLSFPGLEVQEADGIVTTFLRSSRFQCFDLFAFQVFRLAQASLLRRRLLLLKPEDTKI